MQINRIDVENFRNHKAKSIEFSDGINLILGPNGSGKSSILEAIGIALFNCKGRSDFLSAIQTGEKNSKIRILFTANDNLKYIVEKRLGTNPYHILYQSDNPENKIRLIGRSKSEEQPFWAQIKELTGISHNSDISTTYQYVVTSYQNEIVNGFLLQDREKQSLFNAVFNTEIYRELYEGFLKRLHDEYEKERIIKSELIKIKLDSIKDTGKLEEERDNISKEISAKEAEKSRLDDEYRNLKTKEASMESDKNTINMLEVKIRSNIKNLENIKQNINDLRNNLDNARKSYEIVKETKSGFENYNIIQSELSELLEKISKLEILKKKETGLRELIQKTEGEIEKLNIKIASESEKKNEIAENVKNDRGKYDILLKETTKNDGNLIVLNNQKKQIEELLSSYMMLEKEENELEMEKEKTFQIRKKIEELLIPDMNEIHSEYLALENELKSLAALRENLKNLNKKRSENKGRMNSLEESGEKLKSGLCPFLAEECKNIREKGTIEDYMKERKKNYIATISDLEDKIKKLSDIDSRIEEVTKRIAGIEERKRADEINRSDLNKAIATIELINEKLKNNRLRLENLCIKSESEFPGIASGVSSYKINIENNLDEIKREISRLSGIEKIEKKNLSDLKSGIEKYESQLKEIEKQINALFKAIEAHEKKNKENKEIEKTLSSETQMLDRLKPEEDGKRRAQNALKPDYELYIRNIDSAGRVNEYEESLAIKKDEESLTEKDIEKGRTECETLKKAYKNEVHLEVKKLLETKDQEIRKNSETLGSIRMQLENVSNLIKENEKARQETEEASSLLLMLERKQKLHSIFREKVKQLGKFVGETLMKKVGLQATENFRRLTGRTERITWENSERESYAVYLTGGGFDNTNLIRTSFRDLSGGEQVIVALSMRSAITTMLTKTCFSIFDEPTINLDIQKREALAAYLKEILKGINQAIIVTHDGSFEEMAKTVIRFDRL